MWMVNFPILPVGSLACSHEMISLGYKCTVARSISWSHPCRFLGEFFVPRFCSILKCPPLPVISFNTLLFHPTPTLISCVPIHPQSTHKISSLFPSQGDSCILSWAFSFPNIFVLLNKK